MQYRNIIHMAAVAIPPPSRSTGPWCRYIRTVSSWVHMDVRKLPTYRTDFNLITCYS